jgi:hypothetical protein
MLQSRASAERCRYLDLLLPVEEVRGGDQEDTADDEGEQRDHAEDPRDRLVEGIISSTPTTKLPSIRSLTWAPRRTR